MRNRRLSESNSASVEAILTKIVKKVDRRFALDHVFRRAGETFFFKFNNSGDEVIFSISVDEDCVEGINIKYVNNTDTDEDEVMDLLDVLVNTTCKVLSTFERGFLKNYFKDSFITGNEFCWIMDLNRSNGSPLRIA